MKTRGPVIKYVNFKVFKFKKFKMAAISSYLKLRQNRNYTKWAESQMEQIDENQISISIFITEIY